MLPVSGVIKVDAEPLGLTALGIDVAVAVVSQTVDDDDESSDGDPSGTSTGVTIEPSLQFTVDLDRNRLKRVAHLLRDGDQIEVASTTTLPAGLAAGQRYFVVEATPNAFAVAMEPNGFPVGIESAGEGTHAFRVPGQVKIDFQPTDVAEAGAFWVYFILQLGGETTRVRFPLTVTD